MSTDTLDPQVEEAGIPDEGPSTLPFEAPAVEAGGEDPELELAIADAHAEGMPVPPDPEAKPGLRWEDRPQGLEWAMEQIIAVNKQVIDQKATVKEAQAVVKDEKETLESLQDQLNRLILDAEKARAEADPDPERFPLFDKPDDPNAEAKAGINAQFSKPEAIAPLPADDFEEFHRRAARDESMMTIPGVTVRTRKALRKAGIETVADLGRFTEDGRGVSSIKGVGEAGAEEILRALVAFNDRVQAEWDAAHPDLAAKASGATT